MVQTAQLPGESLLLTLAQIGLAFAGFSALILTLRQESQRERSVSDVNAIKFVLEHSFALLALSLLPLVLFPAIGRPRCVWSFSSLLLAAFAGWEMVIQHQRIRAAARENAAPRRPGLMRYLFFVPTCALLLVQLASGIFWGSQTIYGAGLLFLLFQASVQFWVSLLYYTGAQAP